MSQPASNLAPVCPRHPDRVAYVRCQRCDQPVCPNCQVPSAVGVRCVDCAQGAAAARRPNRTVLGGMPTNNATVTIGFIAACVLVFLAQQAPNLQVTGWLAFNPSRAAAEPWRFLTTALLHGSTMHLAFNMFALWVVGGQLEGILGRWRYLCLLLVSALGGSTMIYLLATPGSESWLTWTVGASGAVFGLFATMFVVQRRFGRDTSAVLGLLGINLVISFVGANISWQGHIGGMIAGAALAAIYVWAPRGKRTMVSVAGTVAITLLLLALVTARALLA
ncbi:Rhomboid protease glpG [Actinomyces bovis]|uniref:Rhomboid protease glpG n=1 Tax=Actinomyces bovis TaxID=1658 RepID=A0ABY1VTN6_9ACTO|nr:rhomboid family intramembrane serine protease [Actinomyces bovis]SPT54388.1 Rhomboid protease glpG [Actinomyces bovis]VEG56059.1 Rhomboid protease glpG [Actinomyces israelii]